MILRIDAECAKCGHHELTLYTRRIQLPELRRWVANDEDLATCPSCHQKHYVVTKGEKRLDAFLEIER